MPTLHNDPMDDPKSIERLNKLFPALKPRATFAIGSLWVNEKLYIRVAQGLRTYEEQDALYALGRTKPGKIVTNAKAGTSWHNFGLAFDIVLINNDGSLNWSTDLPSWITARNKFIDEGLIQIYITSNGKRWTDAPHFEYHPNTTLSMVRRIYEDQAKGDINKFYDLYASFISPK